MIGTGGYVCGPILFWAAMKRVPTCIQEQNAMPGVTNKILSRFVDEVFLGYQEGGRYFASHAKKLFTGNPVRREILEATREEGLKKFGLDPDKTTLLAFGGSRGARTINQAMVAVEQQLAGNSRIQILHATVPWAMKSMRKPWGIRCSMPGTSMWCPISTICPWPWRRRTWRFPGRSHRAGGTDGEGDSFHPGSLSLCHRQPPGIQCPGPGCQGAAIVALDKDLTGDWLLGEVEKLLQEPERLETMHRSALRCAMPQAADAIAEEALALAERNK